MPTFDVIRILFNAVKTIHENRKDFTGIEGVEFFSIKEKYIPWKGKIEELKPGTARISNSPGKERTRRRTLLIHFDKYVQRLTSKYETIRNLSKLLSSKYKKDDTDINRIIHKLTQYVLSKKKGAVDQDLARIATLFRDELEGRPLDWKNEIFVVGFYISNQLIRISDDLKIRSLRDKDFDAVTGPDIGRQQNKFGRNMPTAVISVEKDKTDELELNKLSICLVRAMRLFDVGSVSIVHEERTTDSILREEYETMIVETFSSPYSYTINNRKSKLLRGHINTLVPFFEKNYEPKIDKNPNSSIIISMTRYEDALARRQSLEARITNVITGLEALYLGGEERQELTRKLSQRASHLLGFFGFDSWSINSHLKESYQIRSTYIHGSYDTSHTDKKLQFFANSIINYLRLSILIFIYTHQDLKDGG